MPKREINEKGQDVLTMGPPKETEEHKQERIRIKIYCHKFYHWLKERDPMEQPPSLTVYTEYHVLSVPNSPKVGFAVCSKETNWIGVAIRGKHECVDTFEEALQLCLESVAHEYWHLREDNLDERAAERYARQRAEQYLTN